MKCNAYMPVDKFCGRGTRPVFDGVEHIDTVICYFFCEEQCERFLTFSENPKISEKKEVEVPIDFKLSIRHIALSKARMEHWEILNSYCEEKDIVKWIKTVLRNEGLLSGKDEMKWWKKQIKM